MAGRIRSTSQFRRLARFSSRRRTKLTDFDATLGATRTADDSWRFLVWAPFHERLDLHIVSPAARLVPMVRDELGYHVADVAGISAGTRYMYRLSDGAERPDPVSHYQPEGVHSPSEVVDPDAYDWSDAAWCGIGQADLVFYELHVGTMTPEGTFDALIDRLDRLVDLGITAVELMPVNQCPGERNWGYDGVQLFAVQNSYGGPEGLRRLVDTCHARGLAVFLDLVYNHLGPEGNYLAEFGPYFTDQYKTPWGPAINFDTPDSDEVRRFFMQNALHWVDAYHIDGFRFDAIHAIRDQSPVPFLREMTAGVHERAVHLGRQVHIIAESNMNDPRVANPRELGGLGFDAEWTDDFHHALHALLTGEKTGYYRDFGNLSDLVTAYRSGFVYTGRHMTYRGRRHGDIPRLYQAQNFVAFAQNHDQIGNRAQGDRLSTMIPFEMQKVVAGLVLLAPYLPMLFMGEEYGETAPFQYFVDHSDPELIEAVRQGRRREFTSFEWHGDIPDPQAVETFERSKLNDELLQHPRHRALWNLHQELLRLRREFRPLADLDLNKMEVVQYQAANVIFVRRWSGDNQIGCVFSLSRDTSVVTLPLPDGDWHVIHNSADPAWHGTGSQLPDVITSTGEAPVMVGPMNCIVLARSAREQ